MTSERKPSSGGSKDPDAARSLLIPVREVARIMNVSTRSVWRLLSAGKLPRPLRIGGAVRWRRDDLERWIADGCPDRT